MREGIGSVFLYNIIIVFILVIFAFIGGTVSYYKAFKVNTLIVHSIERYEGFNTLSKNEINTNLLTIGYRTTTNARCSSKNGVQPMETTGVGHEYCVYQVDVGNNYYVYEVVSYIFLDLPLVGERLSIPIYSKTQKIYRF